MAAGTVTNHNPVNNSTGIRLFEALQFQCDAYNGTDSVAEVQLQITLTADTTFAASPLPYDSGLRAVDGRKLWSIGGEMFPDLAKFLPSTAYRWRMRTRNTTGAGETSAWSTATVFTTAAQSPSAAEWMASQ